MTFRYEDCKPHEDGKRRAVDQKGTSYVLLCGDAPGGYSIHGYESECGEARCWTSTGQLYLSGPGAQDLIGPAPEPPIVRWVNVYDDGTTGSQFYASENDASVHIRPGYVYTHRIEIPRGKP